MTTTTTTRHVEAPLTLTDNPPRTLSFWAQLAMWASFGISLFGPLTGALVVQSVGSVPLGILACAVGTAIGVLLLSGSAAIGATIGAPSMVCTRGIFGRKGSLLPTFLNMAQNIGWGMMEVIVISSAAASVLGAQWRWPFVILAGALCTWMAIKPLGTVTFVRRIMLWLVLICSVYLFVTVVTQPAQPLEQSGVIGFWPAVDLAAAQVISFCPLAADYSRHAKSVRGAFHSTWLGYGVAVLAYYSIGAFAVGHLAGDLSGTNLITALVALPAGAIAIGLLLLDELDQAFANVYSTTVSVHNLAPFADRRIVSVVIGVIVTVMAGVFDFTQYESFLYLIGSAFVPLAAVSVVDFFWVKATRWDVAATAKLRWAPTAAWIVGIFAYQMIYPGDVPGWSAFWKWIAEAIGWVPPIWMGSTLGSIVVSALCAFAFGAVEHKMAKASTSTEQTDEN